MIVSESKELSILASLIVVRDEKLGQKAWANQKDHWTDEP